MDQFLFYPAVMLFHDDFYLARGGEVGAQSTFKVTHEVDTIYDHVRLQLLGTLFLCDFCKLKKKSWPYHIACGISVLPPGMEPIPPAADAQSLNNWQGSLWQHWLFKFLLASFRGKQHQSPDTSRNIFKMRHVMGNVSTYKSRMVWWTPIWLLPSFNKYFTSNLVSSSPLSTLVPAWNYFQANVGSVLEWKLAIQE